MPAINPNVTQSSPTPATLNLLSISPTGNQRTIPINAVNQARGAEGPETVTPTALTQRQTLRTITLGGLREILTRAGHPQRGESTTADNFPVRQQNTNPTPREQPEPKKTASQTDYEKQGAQPKTTSQHHQRARRNVAENSTASTSLNTVAPKGTNTTTLTSTSASANTATSTSTDAPAETGTPEPTAAPYPEPGAHTYICGVDRHHNMINGSAHYDPDSGPYVRHYAIEAYFPYGPQRADYAIGECDAVRNQTHSRDCDHAVGGFCESWFDAVNHESKSDCEKIKEYVNSEHPLEAEFVAPTDDYDSDHNHHTELQEQLKEKYGYRDCNPSNSTFINFVTTFFGALLGSSAAILLWKSGKALFNRTFPEKKYQRVEEGAADPTDPVSQNSENIALMDQRNNES